MCINAQEPLKGTFKVFSQPGSKKLKELSQTLIFESKSSSLDIPVAVVAKLMIKSLP